MNATAVDGVLDFVFIFETTHHSEIRSKQLNGEEVLAIERQRDLGENASDGADRHSFKMDVLRGILPDMENLSAGSRVGISYSECADGARCSHVALEQNRRYA